MSAKIISQFYKLSDYTCKKEAVLNIIAYIKKKSKNLIFSLKMKQCQNLNYV